MIENFAAGTVQDAGEGAQTSEAFYEKTTDDEVCVPQLSLRITSRFLGFSHHSHGSRACNSAGI